MPLPSSGDIALTAVAGEFGVSGSYSMKSFYRGGGNVPDSPANSGVPTSGAISLTDFYSASSGGTDVTPNAINWGNVSGDISGSNSNQTFGGIDTNITVSWSYSGTGSVTVLGVVNNGSGAGSPVSIANGDTLRFSVSSGGAASGTVTVVNVSDSSTTLDTFTVSMTGL